jgi:dCMP deaminase
MTQMQQNKWHSRFVDLAKHISEWSKDPSTKVGAVIVDEKRRIISTGYNGFSIGVEDTDDRLFNRDIKYEMIVHGEINAIVFARQDLTNTTLYTYPFMPCSRCASIVIQSGIKTVVAPENHNPRWTESFALSTKLFNESNVKLILL